MIKAGIMDGDLLVVDRSLNPSNSSGVIAAVAGELTVKHLEISSRIGYFLFRLRTTAIGVWRGILPM